MNENEGLFLKKFIWLFIIGFLTLPQMQKAHASENSINYRNLIMFITVNKKNKEGIESFVDKGVISIIIDHEILGKTAIHNTHMQSDTLFWPYYASIKNRQKQQKELKQYLNKDNFKNITNILCGDMNDKYNYISDLCNSQINLTQMNEEELITFPYSQCQLDYILFNKTKQNYEINYKCLNSTENKLSDHNMLLCEINLSTCGDSGYNGDSDESINSN